MLSQQIIHKKLKEIIGNKRYKHSVGVMETAKKLAKTYGCNVKKAELAGLLHDCGRIAENQDLLKIAIEFGIILDDVMKRSTNLIHGPLGAKIAQNEFGIKDMDILKAISYHTTGRENMSLLEKIVYLADYIEPGRDFSGVERIRELAYRDLDKAILLSMDNTIKYVVKNEWLLHIDTIKARNFILSSLNSQ
ncbi:bis(5'-nucleosyl)-tetraphosphatase (symmetrical) YqeK [Caldisalinibacter kiritimatiensis]|uniref:bis(5'-nucleosyl)-tetraphosphatase (symmetrical) n=1 Tax=Caldisalinibacter kiritimatiensis TaxID=1304284 RepID=R1AT33_9FIRM|nr:bis(5'-nucleosyl)-tetraphosphatase (symmetrical) YqeK [Caldisalinibacter kiritimatiensis]EOC99806.1 Hydrolase (HAD superfamily), YqeK [Caldisalinibacter kiritimatiensis]